MRADIILLQGMQLQYSQWPLAMLGCQLKQHCSLRWACIYTCDIGGGHLTDLVPLLVLFTSPSFKVGSRLVHKSFQTLLATTLLSDVTDHHQTPSTVTRRCSIAELFVMKPKGSAAHHSTADGA